METRGRDHALARLVHDVGKYVARTAKNLPEGDVSAVLQQMLLADLYALDGARPASAVFAERARDLEGRGAACEGVLARTGALLAAIDREETAVRRGDLVAVRRVASLACEVEQALRGLLR